MNHRLQVLIAILPLWVSACGDDAPDTNPPIQPAVAAPETAPTPAPVDPAKASPPKTPSLPALVDPKKLEALLAERQGDWPRIELLSTPVETGDGPIVQVSAAYQKQVGQPMVYVMITDTRGIKSLHLVYKSMRDQPNTGIRSFDQAGHLAVESFSARPLNTVAMVLVSERYLVMVNGEGSDQATVKMFLDGLDLKALTALK